MRSPDDLVLVGPQAYGEVNSHRKLSVASGFGWPILPDRWIMYRTSDSIMIARSQPRTPIFLGQLRLLFLQTTLSL
jgi:hypothetical protein